MSWYSAEGLQDFEAGAFPCAPRFGRAPPAALNLLSYVPVLQNYHDISNRKASLRPDAQTHFRRVVYNRVSLFSMDFPRLGAIPS